MSENKVIFLGDIKVGKTSLIKRYINNAFDNNEISNNSSNSFEKKIIYKDVSKIFKIWDTPGNHDLRESTKDILKDVKIVVLVYDITVKSSFLELQYWLDYISEKYPDTFLILVGNKHDLSSNRKIKEADGLKFANVIKAKFTEISAKNNYGWDGFLDDAFKDYLKIIEEKEIEKDDDDDFHYYIDDDRNIDMGDYYIGDDDLIV